MPIHTIESVKLFQYPLELDGVELTENQAIRLATIIDRLIYEAEHEKETAVKLAKNVFRRMHQIHSIDEEKKVWCAVHDIEMNKGHGKTIRNRFYKQDWLELRKSIKEHVMHKFESGSRNNKTDKERIVGIIDNAIAQLNASDQQNAIKDMMKKHGIRLRNKIEKPESEDQQ
jgi:hypothetical protein